MNLKKPIFEVISQSYDIIDGVNIWVDDEDIVVRTLAEVSEEEAKTGEKLYNEEDLHTTESFMPNLIFQPQYKFFFKVGERFFRLNHERSFHLSNLNQKDVYQGGANIVFGYRRINDKNAKQVYLNAFDIRSATNRKYKDNEFIQIEGIDVICVMYCRSKTDSFKDCAFEIFRGADSILISNLTPTSTEEIPLVRSKFFHQPYHATEEMFVIELPEGMEKIPANEEIEITVTAKCFTTEATRYMLEPSCDIIDTEFNDERYLVADGGYLPAKRIKFVDGVAKARFFADRMQSGDTVQFHIESFANQYTANPTIFEVG